MGQLKNSVRENSMNRLPVLLLCTGAIAVAGCASNMTQAPAVAVYPESEQKVMEAAHHWDLLAEYEASRILDAIKDKSKPIYIDAPETRASAFRRDYPHMLRKHLTANGAVVITEPVFGGVTVEYFVEIVRHKDRGDLAYEPAGTSHFTWYDKVTPSEVVVTTRVLEGNLVLMSDSHAFYYNPGDTHHYVDDLAFLRGRPFPVVDK
jgi:hypothetical protein